MNTKAAKNNSTDAVQEALKANGTATAAQVAQAAGIGRSTATRVLADLHREGRVRREDPPERSPRQPTRWSLPDPANTNNAGTTKLAKGQLGALVADYLAANPDAVLSPHQVAAALGGRSSGAVANALSRMTLVGTARIVTTKPLRYSAA